MMVKREDILAQFITDRHAEDAVIPKSYFWKLFGLIQPRGKMDVAEKEKADFQFLGAIENLKSELLEPPHNMDLQNVRGNGYRVVPYQERVGLTIKDLKKAVRKNLRGHKKRLVNIPEIENLTYVDRRQLEWGLQMIDRTKHDLNMAPRYPKD